MLKMGEYFGDAPDSIDIDLLINADDQRTLAFQASNHHCS